MDSLLPPGLYFLWTVHFLLSYGPYFPFGSTLYGLSTIH